MLQVGNLDVKFHSIEPKVQSAHKIAFNIFALTLKRSEGMSCYCKADCGYSGHHINGCVGASGPAAWPDFPDLDNERTLVEITIIHAVCLTCILSPFEGILTTRRHCDASGTTAVGRLPRRLRSPSTCARRPRLARYTLTANI